MLSCTFTICSIYIFLALCIAASSVHYYIMHLFYIVPSGRSRESSLTIVNTCNSVHDDHSFVLEWQWTINMVPQNRIWIINSETVSFVRVSCIGLYITRFYNVWLPIVNHATVVRCPHNIVRMDQGHGQGGAIEFGRGVKANFEPRLRYKLHPPSVYTFP